jgi:hypothetical protein
VGHRLGDPPGGRRMAPVQGLARGGRALHGRQHQRPLVRLRLARPLRPLAAGGRARVDGVGRPPTGSPVAVGRVVSLRGLGCCCLGCCFLQRVTLLPLRASSGYWI